jgi:cell shape-determining protein MreC
MSKIVNGDELFEEGKKKELFDSLFKVVLEFIEKNAYNTSPDGDRIKQIEKLKEENEELKNRLIEMRDLAYHGETFAEQARDCFRDMEAMNLS